LIDIAQSILAINSSAKFTICGEDSCSIVWQDKTTPIAEADILAKQKELQDAYDKVKFQRDRAEAYPSIANQLDDLYHNGIDGWKKTIKAIKDKHPKE
jgi:hypothetical protein